MPRSRSSNSSTLLHQLICIALCMITVATLLHSRKNSSKIHYVACTAVELIATGRYVSLS